MPVLLVRHAHALPRSSWDADDAERPLSERGLAQAGALAGVLAVYEPKVILSSPARRCMQTVEPLASAVGVEAAEERLLSEGCGRAALETLRGLARSSAVLCSHGDVLPELLGALVRQDRLDLGRDPRVQKASVWVLEGTEARIRKARYLPPPEP